MVVNSQRGISLIGRTWCYGHHNCGSNPQCPLYNSNYIGTE